MISFLVIGRIIIWAMSWTPLLDRFRKKAMVQYLLDCDFCLGTWVYSILAAILDVHLTPKRGPLGCAITGLVAAFFMHIFRIGWEARFNHAVRN